MSVLTAVETVLAEADGPMHYREVTRLIIERGLWTTAGRTPEATVNARVGADIKQNGARSRFRRAGEGMLALHRHRPEEPGDVAVEATATKGTKTDQDTITGAAPLSFTDAAADVLTRFSKRQPMHYRAITVKALEQGLVRTQGKTPEATLSAQIGAEINRQTRRGETPRFVRHGKGLIGLSEWMTTGLGRQIQQHNNEVRKQLHARLLAIPPEEFEALIGRLLGAIGFEEVTVTDYSGDGGIDVRGTLVVGDVIRTRMAVQVKRWKGNIQTPVVQQVRGSLGTHEQGLSL